MEISEVEIFLLTFLFQLVFVKSIPECFEDYLDSMVDNLHSTDDGEPSKESHGASNS